jgi:hypothetical protein
MGQTVSLVQFYPESLDEFNHYSFSTFFSFYETYEFQSLYTDDETQSGNMDQKPEPKLVNIHLRILNCAFIRAHPVLFLAT